jgi:MoaA/NifB/PqqE/SkfB family radical SAM enzyme
MFRQYPLTLQIEPTRRCNLRCKICMREHLNDKDSILSLNDFKKILKSGNFQYVGLHGWGEPLLNPHLFQMIEYAESQGVYTNLTTNGTLIGENMDRVFGSGLREIAFGVYNNQLLGSILPQVKELIRERERHGLKFPRIYVDITIYKGNLDRIFNLLEHVTESGVNVVILHRLFNVYNVDPTLEYISFQEEKGLFMEVKRRARMGDLKLYLPQRHSLPCKVVKHCIFVTAEGKVTPCCFLPEFYLGDALKEGVHKIMGSKRYADFVKTMGKHPICSRCRW